MLWTYSEAWLWLNERYYMHELSWAEQDTMVQNLLKMSHRPWCRTHMTSAPNYSSECTCDGKYPESHVEVLTWETEGGRL